MQHFTYSLLRFVGRLLIGVLFLLSGIGKFLEPHMTEQYMIAKGVAQAPLLTYLSATIEVVGAVLLIVGFLTRWSAGILFLFLTIVTFVMHDFWDSEGAQRSMQLIEFLKNMGILGGLLYIVSAGPGSWAICRKSCSKEHCSKEHTN